MPALFRRQLRWILLLCSVFLTACAGSQISAEKSPKPERDWKYFVSEEQKVLADISASMQRLCLQPGKMVSEDTCVRSHLAPSLDTSGVGQEKCRSLTDAWKLVGCVLEGNALISLRASLRDQNFPAMTDVEWLSPQAYQHKLVTALGTQIANECGQSGISASGALSLCSRTEILHAMGVSQKGADRCVSLSSDTEFNTCLAEAFALTIMRQGLARLQAIEI